jgi:hypothetical protein
MPGEMSVGDGASASAVSINLQEVAKKEMAERNRSAISK